MTYPPLKRNTQGSSQATRYSRRASTRIPSHVAYRGLSQTMRAASLAALRNRSRTATRTITESQNTVIEHRGGSESSRSFISKPSGLYNKVASQCKKIPYTYNENSLLASCGIGKQAFAVIGGIFNPLQVQLMANQALTVQQGGPTVTGYRTQDLFLNSCFYEAAISNQTNINTRIVIYDLVAKMDYFNDSLGNGIYPTSVMSDGAANEGIATGQNIVGYRPWDSELFKQFYKVEGKPIEIVLAPGTTHYHKVRYAPNVRVNGERFRADTNGLLGLKDISRFVLIQHYGSPIRDNAGGATTGGDELLVVARYDLKCSFLPNNEIQLAQTNSLSVTALASTNVENMATAAATAFAAV